MSLRRYIVSVLALIALLPASLAGQTQREYEAARDKLVKEVVEVAGVKDPRVLKAMRQTPRHEFVPVTQRARAY